MAIKPLCDICKKELIDYGAILLSPPDKKVWLKNTTSAKAVIRKLRKRLKNSGLRVGGV